MLGSPLRVVPGQMIVVAYLLGEHGETACCGTMDHGPCVHWTEDLAVVHSAGVSRKVS